MAGCPSKFGGLSYLKKFLTPFRKLNKKIHIPTDKAVPGGAVENPSAGANPGANFRQVGRIPEDRSGYKTTHLGDKKQ